MHAHAVFDNDIGLITPEEYAEIHGWPYLYLYVPRCWESNSNGATCKGMHSGSFNPPKEMGYDSLILIAYISIYEY